MQRSKPLNIDLEEADESQLEARKHSSNRVVPLGLGQRHLSVSEINVTVQQELL